MPASRSPLLWRLKCGFVSSRESSGRGLQPRTLAELHLGLLGPSIRAEVGDTVNVVFRNTVRFPTTIHVHGLLYSKSSEGSPYSDGTTGDHAPPPSLWLAPLHTLSPRKHAGRCSSRLNRASSARWPDCGQSLPATCIVIEYLDDPLYSLFTRCPADLTHQCVAGADKEDDYVLTNATHTYVYQVPDRSGPGVDEASSKVWM